MAGAPKGPILDKIKPHLFFDDQVTAGCYGLSGPVTPCVMMQFSNCLFRLITLQVVVSMDYRLLMYHGVSPTELQSNGPISNRISE